MTTGAAEGWAPPDMTGAAESWAGRSFAWRDGERLIRYGRGTSGEALELLRRERLAPFVLLTTARAAAALPALAAAAEAVAYVPSGPVPEAAAATEDCLPDIAEAATLVAVGGGRVVDACKALAAAHGGSCAALPTTLSGAEMTAGHRPLPDERGSQPLRPRLVIADPALMASQPAPALTASAMNAFGHAMEALWVRAASPVTSLAALEGARLIVDGLTGARADDESDEAAAEMAAPDRLALGAVLAGYAIGATGLGLHHALCQTVVRSAGTPHAETNAVMAPHVLRFMLPRAPAALAPLVAVLAGTYGSEGAQQARAVDRLARLTTRSGVSRLGELGVTEAGLPAIAATAARRRELRETPGLPGEGDVLSLLRAAL